MTQMATIGATENGGSLDIERFLTFGTQQVITCLDEEDRGWPYRFLARRQHLGV